MKMKSTGWAALLLVLSMLLAGCSEKPEEIAGKMEAPSAPAAHQETILPQEQMETQETLAEENPLTLGRMEGGTYRNSYAGFGCTLDESWTYYSAEELQTLPESVAKALEGTEVGEGLEAMEQVTDMMAENVDLLSTINVLYQKCSLQERMALSMMGEEAYLDAMVQEQGQMMRDSYAQVGIEITSMERIEVEFLGQTRSALHTVGVSQNVPVYFTQILDYSRGSYSVTTTFTSYVEDNTQNVMALFFPVE